MLRRNYDIALVIVGEGDQQASLQALIAELGQQERIRLLGYRSDVMDWYEAMDIFALSSFREGLPNVLLEALALEVPVVATRIAGIPRLIRDGDNGLLIEPGKLEDLTGPWPTCWRMRTCGSASGGPAARPLKRAIVLRCGCKSCALSMMICWGVRRVDC